MSERHEHRKCLCGHEFYVAVTAPSVYFPPEQAGIVPKCHVCESPTYKKLRREYDELLRRLP